MTTETKKPNYALALREQLENRMPEIAAMLSATKMDPERFLRVALLAATKNPGLKECKVESIFLAVMESARLGLQPDNKEAAIVKFGDHAELLPMVGGVIRLMLRSPGLLKVEARVVRDGDEFDYRYGLDPQLVHKPIGGSDREITHAYAVMWRQGAGTTFEVVTREEIEQVRLSSRAPNSPAWRDWLGEMCRKVALKRLAKYADLSPEATRAIELDHFVTGSEPWGGEYVDASSEEYRSQMVKSRTEDRLEGLKARLSGEEEQRHPPLEQEVTQVDPGVEAGQAEQPPSEEPDPDRERQFTPTLLDELVETKLSPNREDAAKILGLSPWASTEVPLHSRKQVMQWFKDFNEFVDIGANQKQAAQKATARWKATQQKGGAEDDNG